MFIILIGIGLIRAPLNFWPGVLLIFLIRIGIRTLPADVAGGGRFSYLCILIFKAGYPGKRSPGDYRGIHPGKRGSGLSRDRPFRIV
jgi:hypothetical protein